MHVVAAALMVCCALITWRESNLNFSVVNSAHVFALAYYCARTLSFVRALSVLWYIFGLALPHTRIHTLHILSFEHCRVDTCVPATNCILFVRRVVVLVIRTRIPSNIKYAVEKSGIQNLFAAIVIMCVVLCTIFLIYKKLFFCISQVAT